LSSEPLTDRTIRLVERLFHADDAVRAQRLLVEECATNLPFCDTQDAGGLERIRFAVLLLSEGDIDKLRAAIDRASADWRDVLVAAGFGYSLTAHEQWATAVLQA
jgi:hypothetical protein